MKNLPKAITFPQFLPIIAYVDDDEEEVDVFIGDITFADRQCEKFSTSGFQWMTDDELDD